MPKNQIVIKFFVGEQVEMAYILQFVIFIAK